ncbi:MAG: GNAT family N-acetyltransferase [Saprospiraceae bacterium]
MSNSYVIRPPQSVEEWAAVKKLLIDYKNEFEDDTCFTSFEAELSHIEAMYQEPGKYKLIVVEEPGGRVVGCVGMRTLSPGVAEMKRLYVIPSHRRLHLGKRLANEIIDIADSHAYQRMILDTMTEMKDAQRLYQRLGFEVIKPYNNQDPAKVICYEKILSAGNA